MEKKHKKGKKKKEEEQIVKVRKNEEDMTGMDKIREVRI